MFEIYGSTNFVCPKIVFNVKELKVGKAYYIKMDDKEYYGILKSANDNELSFFTVYNSTLLINIKDFIKGGIDIFNMVVEK